MKQLSCFLTFAFTSLACFTADDPSQSQTPLNSNPWIQMLKEIHPIIEQYDALFYCRIKNVSKEMEEFRTQYRQKYIIFDIKKISLNKEMNPKRELSLTKLVIDRTPIPTYNFYKLAENCSDLRALKVNLYYQRKQDADLVSFLKNGYFSTQTQNGITTHKINAKILSSLKKLEILSIGTYYSDLTPSNSFFKKIKAAENLKSLLLDMPISLNNFRKLLKPNKLKELCINPKTFDLSDNTASHYISKILKSENCNLSALEFFSSGSEYLPVEIVPFTQSLLSNNHSVKYLRFRNIECLTDSLLKNIGKIVDHAQIKWLTLNIQDLRINDVVAFDAFLKKCNQKLDRLNLMFLDSDNAAAFMSFLCAKNKANPNSSAMYNDEVLEKSKISIGILPTSDKDLSPFSKELLNIQFKHPELLDTGFKDVA